MCDRCARLSIHLKGAPKEGENTNVSTKTRADIRARRWLASRTFLMARENGAPTGSYREGVEFNSFRAG
jgi:hypothetical protein